MYKLMLFRHLLGSDQDYFNELKRDTSIKQIRGWRKQNFNSLIDITHEHKLLEEFYFIDRETFSIKVWNSEGKILRYWRYYIVKEGS